MTRLSMSGVALSLPPGWEGRVRPREPDPAAGAVVNAATLGQQLIVLHAANFPLPPQIGDFGGGTVDAMRSSDLFVSLFEYGSESVGTALFRAEGIPRAVGHGDFDPFALRTPLPGLSGLQRFFTVAGRPFSLYVVLGSHLRRVRTVPLVNQVLAGLAIGPRV